MKHLPIKLAIFVILLFALVITTCLLWTPLKIRYYANKLRSHNPKERVVAVDELLAMGNKGRDALVSGIEGGEDEAKFLAKYWEKPDTIVGKLRLSPLHVASENGHGDAVSLLIAKGHDVNNRRLVLELTNGSLMPGKGGYPSKMISQMKDIYITPLDLAKSDKMKFLLRSHGAKKEQELNEKPKK